MDKPLDVKKEQKELYRPSAKTPVLIEVPEMLFLKIDGKGNPNSSEEFQQALKALYGISYGLKMSPKKDRAPQGYYPYVVAPLEGYWSLPPDTDPKAPLNKDKLIWTMMIRQPEFLRKDFFQLLKEEQSRKEPNPALEKIRLEKEREGLCCQMMHLGSYDDEPASFQQMEEWVLDQGYKRLKKSHREIYLSDFRKVAPEKLKTILRFQVEGV